MTNNVHIGFLNITLESSQRLNIQSGLTFFIWSCELRVVVKIMIECQIIKTHKIGVK
jgi:hypothetical protein